MKQMETENKAGAGSNLASIIMMYHMDSMGGENTVNIESLKENVTK